MMIVLKDLCWRLSRDSNSTVQLIGRRCLNAYDEFEGLRYAGLAARDARHLADEARVARDQHDAARADLLLQAEGVVRAAIAV